MRTIMTDTEGLTALQQHIVTITEQMTSIVRAIEHLTLRVEELEVSNLPKLYKPLSTQEQQ